MATGRAAVVGALALSAAACAAAAAEPDVTPRTPTLPAPYAALVERAGGTCPAVTPELLAAQIESQPGWTPDLAETRDAAAGLFTPSRWARVGRDHDADGRASRTDPADVVLALGQEMCGLRARVERMAAAGAVSGEDVRLTLAAFAVGLRAVEDAGGVPAGAAAHVDAVEQAAAAVGRLSVASPLPAGFRDSDNYGVAGTVWSSGYHTGDDFPAPCGTPVAAVEAGAVTVRTDEPWAGEALVEVAAADGTVAWYAHMQSFSVADGDAVSAGQQLGAVGDLGNAYGCHLHLEVHPGGGNDVDPHAWLAARGAVT